MIGDSKTMQKHHPEVLSPEQFRELVAERAYHKAEKRGFVEGHELEDWLEAEKEIRNQSFYWSEEVD